MCSRCQDTDSHVKLSRETNRCEEMRALKKNIKKNASAGRAEQLINAIEQMEAAADDTGEWKRLISPVCQHLPEKDVM